MLGNFKQDQNWSGAVILLYALPFIVWVAASSAYMTPAINWLVFGSGLLSILTGSVALILMKRPGETTVIVQEAPNAEIPLPQPVDNKELEEVRKKLQVQAQEVMKLQDENISLKNQNFQVIHAYNGLKKEVENLQSAPPAQDPELLNTLQVQKQTIKEYEDRIADLEHTVEDLKYEMSALMNYNTHSEEAHLPEEEILRVK